MDDRPDAPEQSDRCLRQPVHVGADAFLPRLAVQQAQRAADDVAGRLVLAAVGFDDTEGTMPSAPTMAG
jgi:hypothetical protein